MNRKPICQPIDPPLSIQLPSPTPLFPKTMQTPRQLFHLDEYKHIPPLTLLKQIHDVTAKPTIYCHAILQNKRKHFFLAFAYSLCYLSLPSRTTASHLLTLGFIFSLHHHLFFCSSPFIVSWCCERLLSPPYRSSSIHQSSAHEIHQHLTSTLQVSRNVALEAAG